MKSSDSCVIGKLTRPIRILHLEDDPRDAQYIRDALESYGLECKIALARDRRAFESALDLGDIDLILCDQKLPDYDGISALKRVQARRPEVPVIIISGVLGEEEAVKCLHLGATDYLLKQRLERLPAAVQRALAEAEDHRKRHQTEAELRKSEARYRQLLASATDYIYTVQVEAGRPVSTVHGVNSAAVTGYTPEDYAANPMLWISMVHAADRPKVEAHARQALAGETPPPLEHRIRHKNGSIRWIRDTIVVHIDPQDRVTSYDGLVSNISERKIAEEALAQSELRFRMLIEKGKEGLSLLTADGKVRYLSPSLQQILGYVPQEFEGREAAELVHPEDVGACRTVLADLQDRAGGSVTTVLRIRHRDGSWRWLEINATNHLAEPAIEAFVINYRDITEKKQLEAKFLKTQRLECLGMLASGIAHDLNNVLAPVLIGADILRVRHQEEADRRVLDTIQFSAQRGSDIVHQVLTFARGIQGERVLLQPRHSLREIQQIITETFPKNIQIQVDAPRELWSMYGDATQLHQALMNLSINARDAMPAGGQIAIAAANVELDEAFVHLIPEARSGPHVRFSVRDNGPGIPPEHLKRLFEPFFTTKEPGKGTGLGLATVQGIAQSHGGFVQVSSRIGEGTAFDLYLPAEPDAASSELTGDLAPPARGKGELVLVVDDEITTRKVLAEALEQYGYKVVTASDGAEAILLMTQKGADVAVVIADMIMPGVDGPTLVKVLRQMFPLVPIIGMSGRGEADTIGATELKNLTPPSLLYKPFTTRQLLFTLQSALCPSIPVAGA